MHFITFRRYYLDKALYGVKYFGKVIDIGGKKYNKRGAFRPPLTDVDTWEYLNIDHDTKPDYCCSADNTLIERDSFDIALLSEVLEHIESPIVVLKEMKRILKPNGKLILTMPFLYPVHADPSDYQRWTDTKIKLELEILGFNDISVNAMGGVFAVIYDILYVSLNNASKNTNSFKNKIIRRFVLPVIARIFLWLDERYLYKSNIITTGYIVEAKLS